MLKFIKNWLDDQATWRKLQAVKSAVDIRITYDNTKSREHDWTIAKEGQSVYGDCTCYAATYAYELGRLDIACSEEVGLVWSGGEHVQHAWVRVGKYVLDNRYSQVRLCADMFYYNLMDKSRL